MANDALPTIFTPHNLEEAMQFCERLSKTNFVPKDYVGKPNEILAAIQFGSEVGLGPMQSLQSIAVINGRPSLWGDALLGLVQRSGLLEYIKETETNDAATCEVKRKGDKEVCKVTFSHADAMKAGLASKQGPWTQYPKRMRTMRARGFALRNKFADVLKGLISREEAQDYELPGAHGETVEIPPPEPVPDNPPRAEGEPAVEVVIDKPVPAGTLTKQEQVDLMDIVKALPTDIQFTIIESLPDIYYNVCGVDKLAQVKRSDLPKLTKAIQDAAEAANE